MSLSRRRVGAIMRKELREYRRNRSLIAGMAILPLVFIIQPLTAIFAVPASAAGALREEHVFLYLLGIPCLVPVFVAAYAVVGERRQGTLEPALSTPLRSDELLLGKALAAIVPSVAITAAVYAVFLVILGRLADPAITAAMLQPPDLVASLVFSPLLVVWSVWVGIAVSTRSGDVRVAQQVGLLASLPPVFIAVFAGMGLIEVSPALGVALAGVLVILDVAGWRVTSRLFDPERLIAEAR